MHDNQQISMFEGCFMHVLIIFCFEITYFFLTKPAFIHFINIHINFNNILFSYPLCLQIINNIFIKNISLNN